MELYFPIILDGATGTELQARGYTGDVAAEEWVLKHPEKLQEIQKGYVEAGSQVLYAPTFGANSVKLEEHGIFNRVDPFVHDLVGVSRGAADGRALVAGDLSPIGKYLRPAGDYTFEEMVAVYQEQAAALEDAGVDLYVIETSMTLAEARAAVLAVKAVSRKPVFVTFTCDKSGHTLTGTDVTAALTVMQGMGVSAFGLNCSVGPEDMLAQFRRLQAIAEVPLIAKPNAGLPEVVNGKTVYNCSPEEFAALVPQLAEAGVCIFGGCCGTRKEHIAALKKALENVPMRVPEPPADGLLPLATEKNAFRLPPDTDISHILPVTPDLADVLENDTDESPVTALRITSWDDVELLADNAWALSKPLCLVCDKADLLEEALRIYQGRAMYDGPLTEAELLPLQERYGLIF